MKKLILFVTAFFVLTMSWAYPWHVIWFHDLYQSWGAMGREHPLMEFGMLAILIQGTVIGILYPYYYQGVGHPIVKGVKFSLMMGLMVYSVMGFANVAKLNINPVGDYLIYHTVFQTIQFAVVGVALGWIYRK
ncbi:hypothetical protein RYZ26_13905 [Terasakiella sp. A23]|uniref:hypothetical protein n=1 Tax=Terasakiella sp. FCG-A23 TaxID=3080561 RepID=UPI002952A0D2|nr:hypothetical protein [Terasakiella sp. A23]MDV7340695.1 hypothetical protein [Terasakiella sp. A23]